MTKIVECFANMTEQELLHEMDVAGCSGLQEVFWTASNATPRPYWERNEHLPDVRKMYEELKQDIAKIEKRLAEQEVRGRTRGLANVAR